MIVQPRFLQGRGFFRTAFYFPSVTSSVAITVLWLFLFTTTGAVNALLGWFGHQRPGLVRRPARACCTCCSAWSASTAPRRRWPAHGLLGLTWWDWLSGPSSRCRAFILLAVFTTSGTFMLLFLAALQQHRRARSRRPA